MLITLKTNTFQPISLIDVHQVKKNLKPSPFLIKLGNIVKSQFKQTAFYDFFLIASKDPGG